MIVLLQDGQVGADGDPVVKPVGEGDKYDGGTVRSRLVRAMGNRGGRVTPSTVQVSMLY